MEDNYNGRQLHMEDNYKWKTTTDGRQLQMEDNYRWKTTTNGRQLQMEENYKWKTTTDERQLQMEDKLNCLMTSRKEPFGPICISTQIERLLTGTD